MIGDRIEESVMSDTQALSYAKHAAIHTATQTATHCNTSEREQ